MGKTTEKITDSMKNKLMELYKEGKMDTEIASILGVTSNAIFYWRKKLNLKSTFTYSKISKIDKDKFEQTEWDYFTALFIQMFIPFFQYRICRYIHSIIFIVYIVSLIW